ncbi:hypothetical protein ACFVU2_19185 [Leifsonia sp. NPDC058194]|uniref:hypothetical protein n=1 Tax=Leifsonia sp. NPDC058194 TaxID=3346374 RepID=UPI0036D991A0
MNARTLMPAITADPATRTVRNLLPKTGRYRVATTSLAAYLGYMVVKEQYKHYANETVQYAMAMFDVTTVSGNPATRTAESIGDQVADEIDEIAGDDDVTLESAIKTVNHILIRVYGNRLEISGWLPGYRVLEGRKVIELSGDTCPSCTVNPTGFEVGNRYGDRTTGARRRIARCLNSEDCGWTSA